MKLSKNCAHCGIIFEKPYATSIRSWTERSRFCSRACKGASMRGTVGRRKGKGGGPGSLGGKFIACRICGQPTRYRDSVDSPIQDQVHCGSEACRAASKALRYSKASTTRLAAIAAGTVPVMRDNWRLA
jgi:hypothetical protein